MYILAVQLIAFNTFILRFQQCMRDKLLKMLQEDHETNSTNVRWQEELAKDSQRIAKAGSFRMALIQYHTRHSSFPPPPSPSLSSLLVLRPL